jgi:hypothetical protein
MASNFCYLWSFPCIYIFSALRCRSRSLFDSDARSSLGALRHSRSPLFARCLVALALRSVLFGIVALALRFFSAKSLSLSLCARSRLPAPGCRYRLPAVALRSSLFALLGSLFFFFFFVMYAPLDSPTRCFFVGGMRETHLCVFLWDERAPLSY